MKNLRDEYPLLKQCTYLDTAYHGLMSAGLLDHRRQMDLQIHQHASRFTHTRNELVHAVRTKLSGFLESDYANTALIPNFSLGFNRLLEAWDKNIKILLLENDYPSINNEVESAGFQTVYAPISHQVEQDIHEACEKFQPQVFCLSLVQYISGIQIDMEFLQQLKKDFPDLIIVADATQFVGSRKFCFRESGIDVLIASCYKWLHAGGGNGFICAQESSLSKVIPKSRRIYAASHGDEVSTFISRFEPGHQDILSFGSLGYALDQATSIGLNKIESLQQELSQKAKISLQDRGLLDKSMAERTQHSSIFNIPGDQALFDRLRQHDIIVSQRGAGIRISFCYLNTLEDLSKLLKVLDL
ncbi:aminotransferase class V-fold PLP-dependent enzyme [Nonlabens xiamenensis]|uniref:aminotransferase class V-fold PLP-dependent enzyme n=1 Tax=Nonlabens xiamenensis TaxID=2341043 RepID=UPI000F60466E|nr:aminotransferase class V-fold PLP-dependent enzyme [Nonlabens xiamenensis]